MTYLKKLIKQYDFSIENLIRKYPEYLLQTQFDSYFKNFDIKPYETQVRLINHLKNKEANLIIYKTMMG